MSNMIGWMAAEAEVPEVVSAVLSRRRAGTQPGHVSDDSPEHHFPSHHFSSHQFPSHQFPSHQFPARRVAARSARGVMEPALVEERREAEDSDRERRIYRGRTVAMLRRYLRYSIETGRLPSLLGREFFRAKVTAYRVVTFEDRVIFVHDMDKCLNRLDDFSRQLIARHILQEHDQAATGRLLHGTERTVRTYIPIVLDLLSDILIEVGLLARIESSEEKCCQEGAKEVIAVSDCEDGRNKF